MRSRAPCCVRVVRTQRLPRFAQWPWRLVFITEAVAMLPLVLICFAAPADQVRARPARGARRTASSASCLRLPVPTQLTLKEANESDDPLQVQLLPEPAPPADVRRAAGCGCRPDAAPNGRTQLDETPEQAMELSSTRVRLWSGADTGPAESERPVQLPVDGWREESTASRSRKQPLLHKGACGRQRRLNPLVTWLLGPRFLSAGSLEHLVSDLKELGHNKVFVLSVLAMSAQVFLTGGFAFVGEQVGQRSARRPAAYRA